MESRPSHELRTQGLQVDLIPFGWKGTTSTGGITAETPPLSHMVALSIWDARGGTQETGEEIDTEVDSKIDPGCFVTMKLQCISTCSLVMPFED